jgi:glycosyltransferase involved in cell wall biosynthesis
MKILVVIPVFNKVATLSRAVDSVLQQDHKNFKILIADDGSTDGSAVVAQQFESKGAIVLLSDQNNGVSDTRNLGLQYAIDNEYTHVALLDADDYWQPNHLSTLDHLTQKFPDAKAFSTNYILKRPRKTYKTKFSNLPSEEDQQLEFFFTNNFLNPILRCSTIMVATTALGSIGMFDKKFTHFEDIDWFIRIGMNVPIAFSHKVTVSIDETAQNRSDKVAMSDRRFPDFVNYDEATQKHEGLGKYLSLNRYAIALAYRMDNDIKNATQYQQKVDAQHLNRKQAKLINMSRLQLKSLRKTQRVLGNLGFHLRAGE